MQTNQLEICNFFVFSTKGIQVGCIKFEISFRFFCSFEKTDFFCYLIVNKKKCDELKKKKNKPRLNFLLY